MAFTKSLLLPQANYSAADLASAAAVLARWTDEEPRCRVAAAEVLRLRSDGPMHRWNGAGVDAGLWLQVCFLRKGPPVFPQGTLRLRAAAGVLTDRQDFFRLIARSIRDELVGGAPLVYFAHKLSEDQVANKFVRALPVVVSSLATIFPNLFNVTFEENEDERFWGVTKV